MIYTLKLRYVHASEWTVYDSRWSHRELLDELKSPPVPFLDDTLFKIQCEDNVTDFGHCKDGVFCRVPSVYRYADDTDYYRAMGFEWDDVWYRKPGLPSTMISMMDRCSVSYQKIIGALIECGSLVERDLHKKKFEQVQRWFTQSSRLRARLTAEPYGVQDPHERFVWALRCAVIEYKSKTPERSVMENRCSIAMLAILNLLRDRRSFPWEANDFSYTNGVCEILRRWVNLSDLMRGVSVPLEES